jgi:hypothetical protein
VLAGVAATAGVLAAQPALAVEPEVPIRLQVSLLDRVIPFDRNFGIRVHGKLSALVVMEAADPDSTRVAAQLVNELGALPTLGNYPALVARLAFGGVPALVEECKRLRAGVVYFTPGLSATIERLAAALDGLRVLSVGSLPEQAKSGLVLSFAVRSGKPRVLVNLKQARLQEVDFRADFLRMAEVIA